MLKKIPSASAVQCALSTLSHAQLAKLADMSEVPFGTLWKVRSGVTKNPGIDTVRKFLPLIGKAGK